MKSLAEEVADLHDRLETRKIIDRAKGILMKALNLSEPEAFTWIQRAKIGRIASFFLKIEDDSQCWKQCPCRIGNFFQLVAWWIAPWISNDFVAIRIRCNIEEGLPCNLVIGRILNIEIQIQTVLIEIEFFVDAEIQLKGILRAERI